MLERIKNYVEKRVNRQVSTKELEAALEDAKNNITCNYLLLGYDVTAKDFMDILVQCIHFHYNNSNTNTDSVITIIDQGGQVKQIVGVTILDYNKNTVFGIGVDRRKTWLGKYKTPEDAEKVYNDIRKRLLAVGGEVYAVP